MKIPRLAAVLISGILLCLLAESLVANPQAAPTPRAKPPKTPSQSSVSSGPPAIVFVQTPVLASGNLSGRFPAGSRIVRSAGGATAAETVNLTPEFFAAADPRISFDASKVLFAAQSQPESRWQIWEMEIDGSSKRQVTSLEADCVQPAYLAHDAIVFTVASDQGSQVYVSRLDGTEAHAITFGPGNFQVETVLRDGRILVSAASPLAPGTQDSGGLYVMRHDGTGLASLRCEHKQPARRAEATELADGSIVFVKNSPAAATVGGELAMIRRGALHNSLLSPQAGVSWSPRLMNETKLLVARRSTAAKVSKFDLVTFDAASGKFGGPIHQDPKLSSLQAATVATHPVPRWYWSTLNPKEDSGYFVCLDASQSADDPSGRIAATLSKVRVLILEDGMERSLGEAAVEADGSFYIGVPTDKPVRFELLDASGAVVRAQKSWIWARPGEERGCVGCHEDKSVAPENRWPLALRRLDTPTRLGVETESMRAAH